MGERFLVFCCLIYDCGVIIPISGAKVRKLKDTRPRANLLRTKQHTYKVREMQYGSHYEHLGATKL